VYKRQGYNYMCDWVSLNADRLQGHPVNGVVYGLIEEDRSTLTTWAYIIRSVWNSACQEAGINSVALLSHLKSRELIKYRGRKYTVAKRINKIPSECVAMKLPSETFEELDDDEQIPFPE